MQRHFVKIAYNGTAYSGWQKQPNEETVQGEIEKCISKLLGNQAVDVVGCGRTDAGVHASEFYFHVDLPSNLKHDQLMYKLNKMLSPAIAVNGIHLVKQDAHARFDATSRTYRYFIHQHKNPFKVNTSWYYSPELDVEKMNAAAQLLIGRKDFTSFSKLHTDVKTNICEVTQAEWVKDDSGNLYFEITANRFLRNMVRAIVGTLVEIGRSAQPAETILHVLEKKDRGSAGMSVAAQGLFLFRIQYPYI